VWFSRNGVGRSARRSEGGSWHQRTVQYVFFLKVFLFLEARASSFCRFRSRRPLAFLAAPFLMSSIHPHKKQIRRTSLETHHANAQLVSRFGKNVFDIF
jgi:hypothetical protein